MRIRAWLSALALAACAPSLWAVETGLSLEDAVREAASADPQVRAARAQYEAALHQIDQAYTPADPQLTLANSQTPNGLTRSQTRSVGLSETFQFPGKAWLQGGQARRTAEIARLAYLAAARDARALAQTAYYQTLLDSAAVQAASESKASFEQVLEVARVAYTANQAAQTDLISSQFAVSLASQTVLASLVAEANDEAGLNQVLGRGPQTPVRLAGELSLAPFEPSLDDVTGKALALRQELVEAMLTETNAGAAKKLAWMSLLPDFSVSWTRNDYPEGSIDSAAGGGASHDFSTSLGLSIPLFLWFRQKEDIRSADRLLEAAHANRRAVELQTETSVVQLYRSTQQAYKTAVLYRDVLVPLAFQDFRVALTAYQAKKVDFTTLSTVLQNLNAARTSFLTSSNQFLAGKIALEQAMGGAQP